MQPGSPFQLGFSIPTDLSLRKVDGELLLFSDPIEEINMLRGDARSIEARMVSPDSPATIDADGQLYDVLLEIEPQDATQIRLRFGKNDIVYDVTKQLLRTGGPAVRQHTYTTRPKTSVSVPVPLDDGQLSLRVIVDRPMFDAFANSGRATIVDQRNDRGEPLGKIAVEVEGGSAKLISLKVFDMESIWEEK